MGIFFYRNVIYSFFKGGLMVSPFLINRMASCMLIFAFAAAFSSLRAQYFNVDEIEGPVCIVQDSATGNPATLSPEISQYNIVVTDGLAHIKLTQLFVNHFTGVNDIVYVFPLPYEAAVHAMSMEYDSMLYKAEIFEKQEAQQIYDSMVSAGAIAALLLQDRPNVFQQRLANIPTGDSAFVQLELSMPLKYNDSFWELSIPTMVGERYQSAGASPVPSSGRLWNPPADRSGQGLQINVLIQTGFLISNLNSPTHPFNITQTGQSREILLKRSVIEEGDNLDMPYNQTALLHSAQTYPNKDFVLRFSRAQSDINYSLASFYEPSLSKGYFALNIFPDDSLFSGDRPDLEIILLIDISGSQGGWPLSKEKEIGNAILDKLKSTDRLSVLSFNTSVGWAFGNTTPVEASAANIERARNYINGLRSGGGTDLLSGVQAALSAPATSEHERYFVFLTDGFITNEDAIFEEIKNHPSNPTIFTFGAGNNLNRYFLEQSAAIGNGYATEITYNEDAGTLVDNAWQKIESPQLKNITVQFSGTGIHDLIMPLGTNLYVGSPVEMYGTYITGGPQIVQIKGYRDGSEVIIAETIELAQTLNCNRVIPKIWAKQLIEQLSNDEGTTQQHKDTIIELSITHQVLSKYTAFLAINPVPVDESNSISGDFINATPARQDHTRVAGAFQLRIEEGFLTLQFTADTRFLELKIFDCKGRLIYSLASSEIQNTRLVKWDGILSDGTRLRSGNYIARIRTDRGIITRRFTWNK
ncbi:MAG: VWA domain-containing protein [Chitinivibrionales bacterium]|nr:VWA domain-containing protein [Chitinivibrionales bacterium]